MILWKVPGRASCIPQSGALLARLLKLLDYVELHIGLNGQPIALPTSLLAEPPDVVSFLKHYVRNMKFKNGERVSYFTIRVAIGCPDQSGACFLTRETISYDSYHFVLIGIIILIQLIHNT